MLWNPLLRNIQITFCIMYFIYWDLIVSYICEIHKLLSNFKVNNLKKHTLVYCYFYLILPDLLKPIHGHQVKNPNPTGQNQIFHSHIRSYLQTAWCGTCYTLYLNSLCVQQLSSLMHPSIDHVFWFHETLVQQLIRTPAILSIQEVATCKSCSWSYASLDVFIFIVKFP